MIKVLVVGATGLVGSSLVKTCQEKGQEVRALVRPESLADKAKIDPLSTSGVDICEGSLEDYDSLVKACSGVDAVISAVGGFQIGQQTELIKAAKQTSVKKFIPSDYGLDPKAAGEGSCLLFDQKAMIHKAVKEAGLNYTIVHANCFFEGWLYGLGQVGLTAPPEEVELYGSGSVRTALVGVPDVAKVTAATVDDPRALNQELHITANVHSQEELIQTWEEISDKRINRVPVTLEDLERRMAESTVPEAMFDLVVAQLLRSVWIRGDGLKRPHGVLEATELYPNIQFTSVKDALSQLIKKR